MISPRNGHTWSQEIVPPILAASAGSTESHEPHATGNVLRRPAEPAHQSGFHHTRVASLRYAGGIHSRGHLHLLMCHVGPTANVNPAIDGLGC